MERGALLDRQERRKMGFLQGKTAIITGAGYAVLSDGRCGSIGYGIATAYAKEGANLVITGRNVAKLEKAKAALEEKYGVKVLAISAAKNEGLEEVKTVLEEMLREDKVYIERIISYNSAGIIQLIRKQGELISEEYVAEGIAIKAYVPMEVYGKLD